MSSPQPSPDGRTDRPAGRAPGVPPHGPAGPTPAAPQAASEQPGPDRAAQWREQRREAARAHADALAARQRAESTRARAIIAGFLAEARERGVAPGPLHVRSYDGRARYRTPLRGWYLRRDETVGVDTAGEFYVLTAPPSLTARFRGVQPVPQDPPLVIGAGGKDGESIDLPDALARVLAGEV
ncbi:hypothetical protein J1G42_16350 [Cellulomonas sp. zg-ZUI222]|uniref:Uncharacterized protein n=1 Tax=Cellulomonas wangleii TaxID=2816956 RepID=A0ABX8D7G5_9CELL|nr:MULTISPECIES: hypothetical protein [Cellulomonas]MBO0901487.1 hypothetical protein [Cellulomonas sp. zg-ZUI22]MBO0922394.1 hypothetical protein [Cellulomonas wangleii]MBO0926089.1 hypothetical protein [Cellulomonas wangleii]QVI63375.1 hypothetical protein KG103_05685 [Cellulomonas wangleii]